MKKLFSTQPKYNGGDEHEHAGQTECVVRAEVWIVQEDWAEPSREGRTQIDRQIEPTEYLRHQILIPSAELITDVGRHARFDSPCSDRNQAESKKETEPGVVQSKR